MIKSFIKKHCIPFAILYGIIYLAWFSIIEKQVTNQFHVIHMPLDDKIPFIEYFVIPYFLWFAYVGLTLVYFAWKDRDDFCRLCIFLFTGMTIFLVISTIYPNGHYLRPVSFEKESVFITLIKSLYQTDTATNLFPSIHVYNSIGVHLAISHSRHFKKHPVMVSCSFLLMVSIVLSTMFIKQHSVFDVITAFILSLILYFFTYGKEIIARNIPQTE